MTTIACRTSMPAWSAAIIVGDPDADAWMQDPAAGGDLPEVALERLSRRSRTIMDRGSSGA